MPDLGFVKSINSDHIQDSGNATWVTTVPGKQSNVNERGLHFFFKFSTPYVIFKHYKYLRDLHVKEVQWWE